MLYKGVTQDYLEELYSKFMQEDAALPHKTAFTQSTPGLGAVVLRSSALQFVSKIFLRGLKFIRTIILAQLLFPEDFGLFVLASVCMGFVDTFVQSGFQNALVQKEVVERNHLDGAWTLHVFKGLFLGGMMFAGAPLMAHFFNEPRLTDIIQVLSLMLVIDGFINTGTVLLQKEFKFGKKLLYDFSYNLAEMIAVVIAAWLMPNVWALVIGTLAGRVAALVFSYVFHAYRPRFTLRFEGARELFQFGKWVWLGAILSFFVSRGDGIAIGKLISPEALGYYQLAFSLALLPALEIVRSLGVVFFPLFARLKDSREKLEDAFIKTTRMVLVAILPVSVGLYVLAYPLVEVLYGARWLPMVPMLHILIVYGILKSIEYILTPVLLGVGFPKIPTISMAVHGAVMLFTIIPLTRWYGTEGTALSLLVAACVSTGVLGFLFYRHVQISLLKTIGVIGSPLLSSAGMSIVLFFFMRAFEIHTTALIGATVLVGAVTYGLLLFVCDRMTGNQIRNSLLWMKQSISR